MSKALIIAEKPSVATDLQRVLAQPAYGGKFTKEKDYFENEKLIISSAIGHLVEQQLPMGPNGKPLPWKFDCLPVIPDKFDLQPIEKTKSRLAVLVRLMKRSDVSEIINACDAGREGELIFRYIMAYSRVSKPVRRLWMQSMTNQSILEAFKNLRSDTAMLPLADAALCRSESDWLVGINSTRAMTAYRSRYGGFNKTPVGEFTITDRIAQPTWWRPDGREIPYGDPENLLGTHWLALNVRGYGIHGTWEPDTIGHQLSAGCVRMLNENVEELFTLVTLGTPVEIRD